MRRLTLLALGLFVWVLAGCRIEILPTPLPTPSPFPIRPTHTPAAETFTPAPSRIPVTPSPRPAVTGPAEVSTAVQPGPGPGPSPGPQVTSPATPTPVPPAGVKVVAKPSLAVSPAQGPAGTIFTASGQNWLPGEGVFLYMIPEGSDTAGQVGIAVVDDSGRFTAGFTLPADWSSNRQVALAARNYNASRQAAASVLFIASTATPVITAWRGEYFTTPDLTGDPVLVRNDERIDFDWGTGRPDVNVPPDYFSVRWTRQIPFNKGVYSFTVTADDGVRLFIDNDKVIDEWQVNPGTTFTVDRYVAEGVHLVRVEYYDTGGRAMIKVDWALQKESQGWYAQYFANRTLTGAPALVRYEPELTFQWGGASPAPGVPGQDWSGRWTQTVELPAGRYRFYLNVDDGGRLFVDGQRLIEEWHDAKPGGYFADMDLPGGAHDIRVEYYQAGGDSYLDLRWEYIGKDKYPDWLGEYFANKTLSGTPKVLRDDLAVDFDWGYASPDPSIPADGFSARWTTQLDVSETGNYLFKLQSDDGMRFWVDGSLVYDRWSDGPGEAIEKVVYLTRGSHDLRVEYYEGGGLASIRVSWERLRIP